ncbi:MULTISPECIES: hypothetical protein [Streptomyces]|uniref:Type II toxin-antitoxin system RelE/ParE family toxin n=2 Tax=Streptomyces TaxID=1883 RepID=A0ABW7SZF9_9ACTN
MTDWTWEYLPDSAHVVGGLAPEVRRDVERLASRLADAASVKYLGDPPAHESGVSKLLDHAEGRLMVWYQEDRRRAAIYIVRIAHWPLSTAP